MGSGSIAPGMRTLGLLLLLGCVTAPAARSTDDARSSLLAAHDLRADRKVALLDVLARRFAAGPGRLRCRL